MARIVNVKYKCCGLRFDAAIDCDWVLHIYSNSDEEKKTTTPIELFCLDRKAWDVRMIFQKGKVNNQISDDAQSWWIFQTTLDWDFIIKETRKWVRECRREYGM